MPIDSAASLLFNIGANSDDAEENIQRFRSLLSKDLTDLTGEFADWSHEVFGNLGTVTGAMTAATAALGAGVVALAAVMQESTDRYSEYVTEVERGSQITGISVERMSGLKFAADETHTSYEALTTGLTRFASSMQAASEGSGNQAKAFQRLGITQQQISAGEKDMMPLLEAVADRFHGMSSQVEKTAIARDLFGRGGAELVRMLSQGADGLRDFTREAQTVGLVITTQDVVAVNEYKAAIEQAKAQQEALNVVLGRNSIGILETLKMEWAGLIATLRQGAASGGIVEFFTQWKTNNTLLQAQTEKLAQSLAKMGGERPAAVPQKLKEGYSGLSDLLDEIRDKVWDVVGGEKGRIDGQIEALNRQLAKANDEFIKLRNEGKLTAEEMQTQAAALFALPNALKALQEALEGQQGDKAVEAQRRTGEELQELTLRQGEQTLATKDQLLSMEVEKRREAMEKEGTDTKENLSWLAAYEKAERQKITNDKLAEIDKFESEVSQKEQAAGERTHEERVAALNRELQLLKIEGAKAYESKGALQEALAALRKAGLARIDSDEKAAYDSEASRLDEQLQRVQEKHQTAAERIAAQYQADVAKFDAAEEAKTLKLATSDVQRAAIIQQFAAIRQALTDKEKADLQALYNSQGFQGVFGQHFAELIRGNQQLTQQWATSQNQAMMMVKVALESMKEEGRQAFGEFAQAEGAAIAQAMVYHKSIGAAMKEALKSTLESISSRAAVSAIFSLAMGFERIAERDFPAAGAAFTAAAIYGAVAAAAGIAGGAMGSGSSSSGGGSESGPGGSAGLGTNAADTKARQDNAQQGAVGAPTAAGGPHVTVNVYGHVIGTSGVGELCGMLNDAVLNSDQQLTATNTKTGVQVNQ